MFLSLGLKAFLRLIVFDLYYTRNNFAALHEAVRRYPISPVTSSRSIEDICLAVDMACIWYYKEVTCLHRSAVATCLLRDHGMKAEMVSAAQQLPFKSHAWVEIDRRVVNDKPYVGEIFAEMDRC